MIVTAGAVVRVRLAVEVRGMSGIGNGVVRIRMCWSGRRPARGGSRFLIAC